MKNKKSNKYKELAGLYDDLVTSGYYNYESMLEAMLRVIGPHTKVLDLGIGTALLAERLLTARPEILLTGIDFSPDMLQHARQRLSNCARLYEANVVDFDLGEIFECAFSNSGIWNFIETGEELLLCSHLDKRTDNEQGFERVAAHLCPGGRFVLNVQGEHRNMELEISNGVQYQQVVYHHQDGFTKEYYFKRGDELSLHQTLDFRIFSLEEADEMLYQAGFERDLTAPSVGLHVFRKR